MFLRTDTVSDQKLDSGKAVNEARTEHLLNFEAGSIGLQILYGYHNFFEMDPMVDILFFIHRLQSDMAARIAELEEELRRYVGGTSSLP